VVDVAGFPDNGEFTPILRDAQLVKMAERRPVTPALLTAEEILQEGYDAQLVQIDAFVSGQAAGRKEEMLVMQAGRTLFTHMFRGPWRFRRSEKARCCGLPALPISSSVKHATFCAGF